jgi:hypothetical protein
MTLTEALEQVDLEPGKNYRCRVGELWVELRVRSAIPEPASPFNTSDVMLDAWKELPEPEPEGILIAGESDSEPPDIPLIPPSDATP